MKTAEQWINENSQSGPFDLIDSSDEARAFIKDIQRDVVMEWVNKSPEQMRLQMGECSMQEIRSIKAVLLNILAEVEKEKQ